MAEARMQAGSINKLNETTVINQEYCSNCLPCTGRRNSAGISAITAPAKRAKGRHLLDGSRPSGKRRIM
jgi:hypothetical protein